MSERLAKSIRAAEAARDRRDWRRAARAWRTVLEFAPDRHDLWVQLGHALKEAGGLEAAETAYRRALELNQDVADSWLQLGHLLSLTGRLDAAAEAYAAALERDHAPPDARSSLLNVLTRGARLDEEVRRRLQAARPHRARRRRALPSREADDLTARFHSALDGLGPEASPDAAAAVRAGLEALAALTPPPAAGPPVVFDVSDLLGYFAHARLPTGIQRVQIEVLTALLLDPGCERRVHVCGYDEIRDDWVEVSGERFLDLADAALAGGPADDPQWTELLSDLRADRVLAPALAFPHGAWLINLGTSWWLQNYFLRVREAKARFGVRYVPFVHDMIPIMAPEHCVRPLIRDFVSWALGVFAHADGFLTNSEASRRDLMQVAGRLGAEVDPIRVRVVRLDADARKSGLAGGDDVLSRHGLRPNGYMLFVSTLESRKNHLQALTALAALLDRHGAEATPRLVCVGGKGWLNDAVFARLEADRRLKRHVLILSGIPEAELEALYRHAAFTLYPSLYEGWGLPVTEALCHGKAVIASTRSSVPEAGGDLAIYVDPGDEAAMVEAMEALAFDPDWREAVEARVRERFRPRPWAALGADMLAAVDAWSSAPPRVSVTPPADPGRLHRLARCWALGVGPGDRADEAFRRGRGWRPPETWGCRLAGSDGRIVAGYDAPEGTDLRLYLGLRGLDRSVAFEAGFPGQEPTRGRVVAEERRWLVMPLQAPAPGQEIVLSLAVQPSERAGGNVAPAELGVIGFMICRADDMVARADFTDALRLGELDRDPAAEAGLDG